MYFSWNVVGKSEAGDGWWIKMTSEKEARGQHK